MPQDDRLDEIAVLWEEAYYLTRGGEPTREAAARQAEKELEPYKNAVEHGRRIGPTEGAE
jgi:hypothetical protein